MAQKVAAPSNVSHPGSSPGVPFASHSGGLHTHKKPVLQVSLVGLWVQNVGAEGFAVGWQHALSSSQGFKGLEYLLCAVGGILGCVHNSNNTYYLDVPLHHPAPP